MDSLEKESIPMETKYNTVAHVKKFKKFLKDSNLSVDIETIPVNFLAKYLRFFISNWGARMVVFMLQEVWLEYAPAYTIVSLLLK